LILFPLFEIKDIFDYLSINKNVKKSSYNLDSNAIKCLIADDFDAQIAATTIAMLEIQAYISEKAFFIFNKLNISILSTYAIFILDFWYKKRRILSNLTKKICTVSFF
jgi:hypothetical protein